MNQTFYPNQQLLRVRTMAVINTMLAFILLFILSYQVKNLPEWVRIIFAMLFLATILGMFLKVNSILQKIEIGATYFIFYFPFKKPQKFQKKDLESFATACWGNGRLAFYHAIVFQFAGNQKYLTSEFHIENYKALLAFMKQSDFNYLGYIGQNKWYRKENLWSKKWITKTDEEWLIKSMKKNKGLYSYYFVNLLLVVMNAAMLYVLFFQ